MNQDPLVDQPALLPEQTSTCTEHPARQDLVERSRSTSRIPREPTMQGYLLARDPP